jgi:Flp pilus assembly protein TadD
MVLGLLVAATFWGLCGRRAGGFLGAWFLLILAPTSSILPLGQVAYEHRMYLPLAAVVVLAVAGGYALCDRLLPRPAGQGGPSPFSPAMTLGRVGFWEAKKGTVPGRGATVVRWAVPAAVWAAALVALGCATVARNSDYRSLLAIWKDCVDKRPSNPAAHNNLGAVLAAAGRFDPALQRFHEALRLRPDYAEAHNNLGNALTRLGRTDEALEHLWRAVQLKPDYANAHHNLGLALAAVGRTDEALQQYQETLRLNPDFPEAHNNLGVALAKTARTDEAIEHFQQALRLHPDSAEAHNNLGIALAKTARTDEAIEHYRAALRLAPDFAAAHYNLARALANASSSNESAEHYRKFLELMPHPTDAPGSSKKTSR